MNVLLKASWEDGMKLPELAAKAAPIFANPPEGIKRICSYGVIGGKEVYSIYEVSDAAAMTKHVAAMGTIGFDTEVLPLVETGAGIKAVLEAAKLVEG
jgi:hypothetical protein